MYAGMSRPERVAVLLQILGGAQRVAMAKQDIEAATSALRRPVIYCPIASRAFRLITETRVMLFARRKTYVRRGPAKPATASSLIADDADHSPVQ
jgi:hypothetical protein